MGLLKPLTSEPAYLKAGFLGFQGSGKTFTAMLLAIALRRHFKLDGPVAMFDTENGAVYVKDKIERLTGKPFLVVKSRAFKDLLTFYAECQEAGVSVAMVDSITHPWRELCAALLKQINDMRAQRKLPARNKMEFQDWAKAKDMWGKQTETYLNSPLHIIVCGRAGFEYDFEVDEETGKKDLRKTGIKMRVEGEFGFEPSLLVEMDRKQRPISNGKFDLYSVATVLKDRFDEIDGKTAEFDKDDLEEQVEQVWEFFGPHVKHLIPGGHEPVDTAIKTEVGEPDADDNWALERKTRTILCEEIQGEILAAYPGQTADEKRHKADLIFEVFATRSWTAVESMNSEKLRSGLARIKTLVRRDTQPLPVEVAGSVDVSDGAKVPSASGKALPAPVQELKTMMLNHSGGSEMGALALLEKCSHIKPGGQDKHAGSWADLAAGSDRWWKITKAAFMKLRDSAGQP